MELECDADVEDGIEEEVDEATYQEVGAAELLTRVL